MIAFALIMVVLSSPDPASGGKVEQTCVANSLDTAKLARFGDDFAHALPLKPTASKARVGSSLNDEVRAIVEACGKRHGWAKDKSMAALIITALDAAEPTLRGWARNAQLDWDALKRTADRIDVADRSVLLGDRAPPDGTAIRILDDRAKADDAAIARILAVAEKEGLVIRADETERAETFGMFLGVVLMRVNAIASF